MNNQDENELKVQRMSIIIEKLIVIKYVYLYIYMHTI